MGGQTGMLAPVGEANRVGSVEEDRKGSGATLGGVGETECGS